MAGKKHSKKEVQAAIEYAESKGWRIEPSKGSGHAWGRMYCPHRNDDCRCGEFCVSSISSTPRNPGTHAKQIRRVVDNCIGKKKEQED